MTNYQIKQIALTAGFQLKEQADGSMDLNPYVYEFAKFILAQGQMERDYMSKVLGITRKQRNEWMKKCAKLDDENSLLKDQGDDHLRETLELIGERNRLTIDIERLQKDSERLAMLRELMGYVEDGSHDIVKLYQDDATYEFFVSVGKLKYYGKSFEQAIDNAMKVRLPE